MQIAPPGSGLLPGKVAPRLAGQTPGGPHAGAVLAAQALLEPAAQKDLPSPPVIGVRRALAMLVLAAFFWGSGNVANKTVLDSVDPWTAVVLRCLVAAVVLLPFALRELRRGPLRAWAGSSLLPSLLFALAILFQQKGFETASVATASFLVNVGCVITPLLALILLQEPPNRATVAAALLMCAGAATMSGVIQSPEAVSQGDLFCLLSAFVYAGWSLALGRHVMRHGRPVSTTLVQCAVTGLATLPLGLWSAGGWPVLTGLRDALPEVLYLGLFSTALAFLLTVAAQARVPASTATILIGAESLFGAAGGILFLGERPGIGAILGALLMLAALCVVARAPLPSGGTGAKGPTDPSTTQPGSTP